jgi:hypothetical protein
MTKAQELERLRSLIKSLGKDTYLGPWLEEVSLEVEQMIKNDIFPDILPNACAKRVKENMEKCQKDCDEMKVRAAAYCKQIGESAREEAVKVVERAGHQRERLKYQLQELINRL